MLAPYALRTEDSRGRRHSEPEHRYRDAFQRDRDRVIHSRAFRRLENKTQVFTRRYSDHFRNRLTHTIEVAQITRTIAGERERLISPVGKVSVRGISSGSQPLVLWIDRQLAANRRKAGKLYEAIDGSGTSTFWKRRESA